MSREQTANAIAATKRYAAERAVENPAKLEKATRIVAAGLAVGRLTVEDIIAAAPPPTPAGAARLAALLPPVSDEEAAA